MKGSNDPTLYIKKFVYVYNNKLLPKYQWVTSLQTACDVLNLRRVGVKSKKGGC